MCLTTTISSFSVVAQWTTVEDETLSCRSSALEAYVITLTRELKRVKQQNADEFKELKTLLSRPNAIGQGTANASKQALISALECKCLYWDNWVQQKLKLKVTGI